MLPTEVTTAELARLLGVTRRNVPELESAKSLCLVRARGPMGLNPPSEAMRSIFADWGKIGTEPRTRVPLPRWSARSSRSKLSCRLSELPNKGGNPMQQSLIGCAVGLGLLFCAPLRCLPRHNYHHRYYHHGYYHHHYWHRHYRHCWWRHGYRHCPWGYWY